MKQAFAVLVIPFCLAVANAAEPLYSYDCDTPPGHFAQWKRTVSGSETTVTGKLRVVELAKHEKWLPSAGMLLRATGERLPAYGIRLYVSKSSPDEFTLELLKIGGRDPIGSGSIPRTKKALPFSLHLDASGLLKVSFAGIEGSTRLGAFKPATFELNCSTGEFDFTDTAVVEK